MPISRASSYDDVTSAQFSRVKKEDMVTERLHYFHACSGTQRQRYSFSPNDSSPTGMVDDLCPSSLEQRVSACTEVFEVWNNEAWRRRASSSASSSRDAHNPHWRSLSASLSSLSYTPSKEGSTFARCSEHAGENQQVSRSSSSPSTHVVIRITPSNSSGSLSNLSDMPNNNISSADDCASSLPSSGCATGGIDECTDSSEDCNPYQRSTASPDESSSLISPLTRTQVSSLCGLRQPITSLNSVVLRGSPPSQVMPSSTTSTTLDDRIAQVVVGLAENTEFETTRYSQGRFRGRTRQQQIGVLQLCKRFAQNLKRSCRHWRAAAKCDPAAE